MDPHENTTGKNPGQAQSPGPQGSASQAEEPCSMKAESPRKCSICGGPNHHGCGCEAKAAAAAVVAGLSESEAAGLSESEAPPDGDRRRVGMVETEAPAAEQPAAEVDDTLEDILSPEGIIEEHQAFKNMAKDIKTMADGFEGLGACFYDEINYLKLIAGDLITIRKILSQEYTESETEKTETENAG